MKKKICNGLNKVKRKTIEYIMFNKMYILFILLSVFGFAIANKLTFGYFYAFRVLLMDLGLFIFIGALSYFAKAKNRTKYLFIVLVFFAILQIINVIYYKFYSSFGSLSELATLGQAATVTNSLLDKLEYTDFLVLLFPTYFYYIYKRSESTNFNYIVEKIGFKKKIFTIPSIIAIILIAFVMVTSTGTELSRLTNQWNRKSTAKSYGLLFYQMNDVFLTISPKLFSFLGYDEAAESFKDYYSEPKEIKTNDYTGIMKDKNIIFVHMESIQTFLLDVEFNDVALTPNTQKLADEGMFFSNFYPQISTGTSSDSEFTLLTSLMPSSSGPVFVSYYKTDYLTTPKILKDYGYHAFSMHGNDFSMWNRLNAHPSLGYEDFYYSDSYDYTEEDILGLGINDELFFEQSYDHLVDIEKNHDKYMGTVITLSNHSPFIGAKDYLDYDMTYTNENEEIIDNFSKTDIGKYFVSVHYADYALGKFMDMVRESEYFDDTLFVFYGDHDAKFSQKEVLEYLTYNRKTGEFDVDAQYDSFDHELNKSTPLIFWTKNEELKKHINGEIAYPMGMIDLMPTILNMYDLNNPYALGNDIFNIKSDNYVVFPNSSFLTKDMYYNNSTEEYKILKENVIIDDAYIKNYLDLAGQKIEISNAIIKYDLIKENLIGEDSEED